MNTQNNVLETVKAKFNVSLAEFKDFLFENSYNSFILSYDLDTDTDEVFASFKEDGKAIRIYANAEKLDIIERDYSTDTTGHGWTNILTETLYRDKK